MGDQRPKAGDISLSTFFGSFRVVVLAFCHFHYRTEEQNNIPEVGTPPEEGTKGIHLRK